MFSVSEKDYEKMTAGLGRFFGKVLEVTVLDGDGRHRIKGTLQRFTTREEHEEMGYRIGALIDDMDGRTHWTTLGLLEEAEIC